MPTSTRRQAHTRSQDAEHQGTPATSETLTQDLDLDEEMADEAAVNVDLRAEAEAEEEEEEEDELDLEPFPPPGLKEISSLASWTVSTAKPGNGVAALRSPDTALFWQSDGPQPHLLSIHFFKLVSIVHIRIFLDFESDESYTPTKIQFLAGMGVHDIQEFAEMSFEHPTGWIDVDFSNVGPVDLEVEELEQATGVVQWAKRPVLRAFLVQVRILENHQNGKDTHLRAVQLFARDEGVDRRKTRSAPRHDESGMLLGSTKVTKKGAVESIKLASWMMEPEIR